LGCHSKTSRYRISRRLSAAAAPVLAGVAVAVCISPQAMASPAITNTATQHTSVSDILGRVGEQTPARLLAASQQAVAQQAGATRYTVKSGDTLSTIAQRVYHDQAAWPVIYWANRKQIHWANDITAGQVLQIPAKPARLPKAPSALGPGAVVTTAASSASSGYAPAVEASTYSGSGGFTSCVIASESGGNSQVMNSSGHYGLYQFSSSTWSEYGGSSADFGHASVAEQNQVFNNALAAGGQSNWSAYDGC
jgi:LysM repeat protein